MAQALPPKKDVALALLERTVLRIHLDPRRRQVVVPNWFKRQPQLALDVGLNLPVPIPDLDVGESGIACTLSFNRTPYYCFIPWHAVFALVGHDGKGMVWPDDVPREVASDGDARSSNGSGAARPTKARAALRSVPAPSATGTASVGSSAGEPTVSGSSATTKRGSNDEAPKSSERPSYLRLVK